MANLRYAPEFRVKINNQPVPAALRASIAGVSFQTGLEGSDRVELSLVNENLRWLDHPLLSLDNSLLLSLGYAPDPLEPVFSGDIVGQSPTFPASGAPMLSVVAQDRRTRLQQGSAVRWFAISTPIGNFPMSDTTVASLVASEQGLIPIFDPIGAALSVLIGGAELAVAVVRDDPTAIQMLIRKQVNESNADFLQRIAHENGWEMLIDYTGPLGGWQLRFMSLVGHLRPDIALRYGQSLIDFTPRITKVGQIASVRANVWEPNLKTEFIVTVSWDWDRNSLNVSLSPGFGLPGGASGSKASAAGSSNSQEGGPASQPAQTSAQSASGETSFAVIDEPVNQLSAPRALLSKLMARLNERLTGSGSAIGDPRIKAGCVLRLEGIGQQFGGLYRVTSATHTVDDSGYRTQFDVRKEIWFGSIPLLEQRAVRVRIG